MQRTTIVALASTLFACGGLIAEESDAPTLTAPAPPSPSSPAVPTETPDQRCERLIAASPWELRDTRNGTALPGFCAQLPDDAATTATYEKGSKTWTENATDRYDVAISSDAGACRVVAGRGETRGESSVLTIKRTLALVDGRLEGTASRILTDATEGIACVGRYTSTATPAR